MSARAKRQLTRPSQGGGAAGEVVPGGRVRGGVSAQRRAKAVGGPIAASPGACAETVQHFIAGGSLPASDGGRFQCISPVTEEAVADFARGTVHDVDEAVAAARAQFDEGAWRRLPGPRRGAMLRVLARLVERDGCLLTDMDARCTGRVSPQSPAPPEVAASAAAIMDAAQWASEFEERRERLERSVGSMASCYTTCEPVGVVGVILSWTAPVLTLCRKLGPLLAAGCTTVIKPSRATPASALHLARLCQESGIPDGVVNVVTGHGTLVGRALCRHPGVDRISFTGTAEVGRDVQRVSALLMKDVLLELGGKSPQIVFDDADLDAAAAGCATGIFLNHGQAHAAGTRVLVQAESVGAFASKLAIAARGMERERVGPIANNVWFQEISRYVRRGVAAGANLIAGAEVRHSRGYFVRPTVFADVRDDMSIAREEIFGPVATVIPFDRESDALTRCDDAAYGLAATIWTKDVQRVQRMARQLRRGAVGVNYWPVATLSLPWNGWRMNGVVRDLGRAGMSDYMQEKVMSLLLS